MRNFALSMILLFSLAFGLEIAHEAGLLDSYLPKDREYWHLQHEKDIVPSISSSSEEATS